MQCVKKINNILYSSNIIYADYIATGKPCKIIENYIIENIYPYYSNPHSNAYASKIISNHINSTKEYIRSSMKLKPNQVIIFTGTGATAATNHLARSLDLSHYNKISIILSLYEHHSNFLPWYELQRHNSNIRIFIIPLTDEGELDYEWYYKLLQTLKNEEIIITSVTACSNVIGIHTDIKLLRNIIRKTIGCTKGLLFVDYACSAPYVAIDLSIINAAFFSMHKFIGGISTPGLLICDKELFAQKEPITCGGGCVKKADSEGVIYDDNLEKREEAGTINIIGQIKTKLVLMLKDLYLHSHIEKNEKFLTRYIHNKLSFICNQYPGVNVLFLNKQINNRLPIICININGCHHNNIVKMLSDKNIMTRGGIACCGLFGEFIKKKYGFTGWCRISFHWLMTIDEVNYILKCIEDVAKIYNI